jgi:hypothetical protein
MTRRDLKKNETLVHSGGKYREKTLSEGKKRGVRFSSNPNIFLW